MKRSIHGVLVCWLLSTPFLLAEDNALSCASPASVAELGPPPTTYEELAAFPAAVRGRVVNALPGAVQSRMWRTHLAHFAAGRQWLKTAERALIDEATALASPSFFASRFDAERRPAQLARAEALGRRAQPVFGQQAFQIGFVELGHFADSVAESIGRVGHNDEVGAEQKCDCAPGYERWNCEPGEVCKSGGCSNPGAPGCGVFHYVQCSGVCSPGEGGGQGELGGWES